MLYYNLSHGEEIQDRKVFNLNNLLKVCFK